MRIGVTGGAGFIGGWVVDELTARGHQALVFDHHGHPGTATEVMLGDVRDATAMTELAAHTDGIIHLAAVLGTQECIADPRPAAETNLMGSLNFLEALSRYDIPGTMICVGNHWMNNPYSITKSAAERFLQMYVTERGTRANAVRAVNAYGPRQSMAAPYGPAKVRKITPAFTARALTSNPVEVYGDGLQVSDMVHVRDVARTLVNALEHAATGTALEHVVEIGPVDHHCVNDVAQMVIKAAVKLGHDPVDLLHLPMRPGEIPGARVTADTTTLAHVGITPDSLTSLEDGITETVTWFRDNWLPGWAA